MMGHTHWGLHSLLRSWGGIVLLLALLAGALLASGDYRWLLLQVVFGLLILAACAGAYRSLRRPPPGRGSGSSPTRSPRDQT